MNFKEALIAHLQGEKVQIFSQFLCYGGPKGQDVEWRDFSEFYDAVSLNLLIETMKIDGGTPFRLAPCKIFVNGVEVPAPESVAPEHGGRYCIPVPHASEKFSCFTWSDDRVDNAYLSEGLVYLREDQAIARAKAMLITQEAA